MVKGFNCSPIAGQLSADVILEELQDTGSTRKTFIQSDVDQEPLDEVENKGQ